MSRITNIQSSRINNFLRFQKEPLEFMLSVLYEGDIVSLRTGLSKPSYVVHAPDFIQEILVTQEKKFRKGRSSQILRRTIGDGLLTTEKEEHDRQKRYMMPSFYKERIQAYADVVIEEAQRLVSQLNEQSDGQNRHHSDEDLHLQIQDEMMYVTLSIITRSMFATQVEQTKQQLAQAVNDTITSTARNLFAPINLPLAFPTPQNRIHRQAIQTLESMIYEVIHEAKKDPKRFELTMLGMLLDLKDEQTSQTIPEQEMRDQMMTLLLAGHETTANLLTWIYATLAQEPHVAEKFHDEIDQLDLSNTSSYDAYRQLSYTQQIIQEALRLYPPAWIILREAEQRVTLLGDSFKAGSIFMMSPYAIHRHKDVFEDPLSFRPERFDNPQKKWPKFTYFPFGGGSRSCIGSQFAMMEATLILAVIGKHYSFKKINHDPVVPDPLVSLRIKNGLMMKAVKR